MWYHHHREFFSCIHFFYLMVAVMLEHFKDFSCLLQLNYYGRSFGSSTLQSPRLQPGSGTTMILIKNKSNWSKSWSSMLVWNLRWMFTGDSLTNISSFTFDFLFSHSLTEEGGRQNLSECSHRASPAGGFWVSTAIGWISIKLEIFMFLLGWHLLNLQLLGLVLIKQLLI